MAEDTGLAVPPEDASVTLDNRVFDVTSVDAATAAREAAKAKALLGPNGYFPDVRDCQVIRTTEHARSGAAIFYLGLCNRLSQINFCLNTKTGDFAFNQAHPEPATAASLIQVMRDCVLETCADGSCQ